MKSRREFIKKAAGASLACSGIGMLNILGSCTTLRFANFTISGDRLIVNKIEFTEDPFVLLSHNGLRAPIYLLKADDSEYLATYLLCTHKGCDVRPAGSILHCGCHGSEFTHGGKLLKGPAERDLTIFETSSDEENVYIHLT